MNVFWQELKLRRRSQLGWIVAMVVFMALSVVKFDGLSQDAAASKALLEQFPATVQAIFGMTGLDLSTLSGYFGVLFIYLLVILAIHAGMVGAGVLADEERDRTTEFLLVKPRSRSQIVTQKLLTGFLYVFMLWSIVVISTWVATLTLTDVGNFMHEFWQFMASLAIVQMTIFTVGAFAAALTKNPKVPTRLVATVVFVSYLIFVLVKLNPDLSALNYISLFSYFDAVNIIHDGRIALLPLAVCGAIMLVNLVGTYVFYRRRDVSV